MNGSGAVEQSTGQPVEQLTQDSNKQAAEPSCVVAIPRAERLEEVVPDAAKDSSQAAMSTTAACSLQRFKIHLVTGDFVKQLSGRRALAGTFSGATVGVMHAHLLRKPHRLADVLAPGSRVLAESANNVLQVC